VKAKTTLAIPSRFSGGIPYSAGAGIKTAAMTDPSKPPPTVLVKRD